MLQHNTAIRRSNSGIAGFAETEQPSNRVTARPYWL